MAARSVRVGRSATGLGLFAARPLAKKDYIVTYRGKRIPTAEAQRRERRFGAKYMFEVNRRWTIDGSSRRNLGRYLNHSCDPNAEAVLRAGKIVFVALRAIAPGEEITLDYGEEYFELYIKPLGCRCAVCAEAKAQRWYVRSFPRKRESNDAALSCSAALGPRFAGTSAIRERCYSPNSFSALPWAMRSRSAADTGICSRKSRAAFIEA